MGEISKYCWITLALMILINYFKTEVIDSQLSAPMCKMFLRADTVQHHNSTNAHHTTDVHAHHTTDVYHLNVSNAEHSVQHHNTTYVHQLSASNAGHSGGPSLTTAHTNQCVEYTLFYAFVLGVVLTFFILFVFISSSEYYNKLLIMTMAKDGLNIESESEDLKCEISLYFNLFLSSFFVSIA